ncbi:MAG: cytochrome C peroxidase, partial [Luminiphilus sp.]|nr:cytochrome C peroxidase [Luminiphilus sp.]
LFTDGDFHNTGTGLLREERGIMPKQVQVAPGVFVTPRVDVETETFIDEGRQEVTGRSEDRWRYRTPSLRNVALTAPYMHDGSIRSLEDVVKFYVQGGGHDPHQDQRIRPLDITAEEQEALVEFLRTLTASNVDALVADARSIEIGDRDNTAY